MAARKWENDINTALRDHVAANAAVIGIGKNGQTLLGQTHGNLSVSSTEPIKFDTPMWIASCTKLLTAISAIQLVQRGKLSLDVPVNDILPELAVEKLEILNGFTSDDVETGEPILSKPTTPITLEMLLTHSSGLSYDIFNDNLKRLRDYRKLPPSIGGTVVGERPRSSTLLFEPGTGWEYSIGMDWAGLMIERVSGLNLEEYFIENIFKPLQMKDTTLDPLNRDDEWKSRLIGRVIRDRETGKVRDMTPQETMFGLLPFRPGQGGGGGGAYSTAQDYIKVLKSLLVDDGVLLQKGSVDSFTRGRLNVDGQKMFRDRHLQEWGGVDLGFDAAEWDRVEWDHSLGGGICSSAVKGLNNKGLMFWGGMLNNTWFLDRDAGTAGFYGTWVYPPGDVPTHRLANSFQRAVYALAHSS